MAFLKATCSFGFISLDHSLLELAGHQRCCSRPVVTTSFMNSYYMYMYSYTCINQALLLYYYYCIVCTCHLIFVYRIPAITLSAPLRKPIGLKSHGDYKLVKVNTRDIPSSLLNRTNDKDIGHWFILHNSNLKVRPIIWILHLARHCCRSDAGPMLVSKHLLSILFWAHAGLQTVTVNPILGQCDQSDTGPMLASKHELSIWYWDHAQQQIYCWSDNGPMLACIHWLSI